MQKLLRFLLFISVLFILPHITFAQYFDHRNRKVDSVEHILETHTLIGKDLAQAYKDLMWGYLEINTEKSMMYAQKLIETALAINQMDFESNGYKVMGRNFYKLLQYDSALYYYEKILETAEKMKRFPKKYKKEFIDSEISSTLGNIGNIYNMRSMYYESISYYIRALQVFEKYEQWKESLALAYFNIGEMYRSMGNLEQAENYCIKMDSLTQVIGDSAFMAYAKYALSAVYLELKDYENAFKNAEMAAYYFFSNPDEGEFKAIISTLLSSIYLDGFNDDKKAEEYALQALQIYDDLNLPKNLAFGCLSKIYTSRREWRKAEQAALKAIESKDIEPISEIEQYHILAKSYSYLGNAEKSNEYIEKLSELQTSWSNKNYQYAIREMEVKYETEKKEFKISNLEKEKQLYIILGIIIIITLLLVIIIFIYRHQFQKNRIIKLQQENQLIATQAILDGEIRERTRLAKDLHDGLGSILAAAKYNLADITNASGEMKENLENIDKAIHLLDKSMQEMRRIAHHLMPDTLSTYGLKQSTADFCSAIPIVTFSYFGDDNRFDTKIEVMLYNVMHELVSNSLKHSGASHILVQIIKDENSITLTVQDDGCGFDMEKPKKGMGLTNIRSRVAAYNGLLFIDSKQGVGTEVNVELTI